jgi:hypothetical protein
MAYASGAYANDAYLRSLDASSADVHRQVQNAYDEIARQQNVAHAQAWKTQGARNSIYTEGQNRLQTNLQALGMQGPMQGAVADSFKNSKAMSGRLFKLLDSGIQEQGKRRTSGVRGVDKEITAGIREKAAEHTARRQAEDRARAFQAQEAERQRALQMELAQRQMAAQQALQAQAMKDMEADMMQQAFFAAVADGISPEEARLWGVEPSAPLGTRFNNAQAQSVQGR